MNALNIAMISQYLPSGSKIGSGYQAHYMANALSRRGHQVTMFSLCGPSEGALYKTITINSRRPRTFRFALDLARVDWSSFDVLHAHGDDYWIWHRRAPVHVRTMHGSCLAEAIYIPRLIEKVRMAMLGFSEMLATLVADATVCVSQNTRRYYPWVSRTILNGVDMSRFYPAACKEKDPTILFVGTYGNRKRGRLLMEAFSQTVLPALPSARLWMVCSDAPAAPGVEVMGRVSLEHLANLYRRATVFCLPSSYEGFGVPYIEAMASGTAVVATPNVGACEILQNGACGKIVEPKDLGTALLNLLRDPAEQSRLEAAGLKRARDCDWEQITQQYECLYAELLRNIRRHGAAAAGGAS